MPVGALPTTPQTIIFDIVTRKAYHQVGATFDELQANIGDNNKNDKTDADIEIYLITFSSETESDCEMMDKSEVPTNPQAHDDKMDDFDDLHDHISLHANTDDLNLP